jgi:putative ABC transport system permease protein
VRRDALPELESLFVELHADARARGRLAATIFAVRACAELVPRGLAARRRPEGIRPLQPAPTRPGSSTTMLDRLLHDLRYALRTFRRDSGYAAVIVLTLAVGIGANTAIFSAVRGVLLDALPYDEPDRVVAVWQYRLDNGALGRMTPGNFVDVRDRTDLFDAVAAFGFVSTTLLADGDAALLRGGRVSADYFDALGVRPLAGRAFRRDDEVPGGPDIAIIGEELWIRRFDADPAIVGRTVNFDNTPFEVIGVLPRGIYPTYANVDGNIPFTPDNHDFLVPLRFDPEFYENRRSHILGVIGRLAEGVTVQRANEAVDGLAAAIREQHPIVAGEGFRLALLRDEIVGGSRLGLLVLMAMVAVVLMIAAANVAGLMLARADARRAETAVRAALGASRSTLIRENLMEGLVLTGAGAAAGVACAYFAIDAMKRLVPFQIPRMDEVALDGGALAFAVLIALLVGLVLGIAPAWLATRTSALARLRQGARGMTADGARRRAQGLLVATQACMAVVLVVGAGLLVHTFLQIRAIDPGFSSVGAITVPVSLPSTRYPTSEAVLQFYDQLARDLAAQPGVAAVAFCYDHPLRKNWTDGFRIEGRPPLQPGEAQGAAFRPVTPGYFEAAGIPLRRGRTFAATDDAVHPRVVVVNEAFVAQFYGDQPALGTRIRIPTVERMFPRIAEGTEPVEEWLEIVGIVGSVRFNGPTEEHEPAMYVSIPQVPLSDVVLLVQPARNDVDLVGIVRAGVRHLDPEMPLTELRTLGTLLSDATARERFNVILVSLFAALALALAGLGIYGLIARLVQSQVPEIGIRVALGAQRGSILGLVLAGALTPVLVGGALGLAAAAGMTRLLESLLYEVGTLDPLTFATTPAVLALTALVAGWLPARRATRIDPIVALRQE